MTDVFTETTTEGWGTRIKNALFGILFGLALTIGSFPLLWWNEGRAVTETRSLEEGQSSFVEADAGAIDAAKEGKLVHVTGNVAAIEPVTDEDFGISTGSLGLKREVEMYQWVEKKETKEEKNVGGSTTKKTTYRYEQEWEEGLVDSSDFRHPEGHENPTDMPYRSSESVPEQAQMGAWVLDRSVIARIDNWQSFTPPAGSVAPEGFEQKGNGFYRGRSESSPDIGDIRVKFEHNPEGAYSFVGGQRGNGLVEQQMKAGNGIMLVENGTQTAEQMFQAAHSRNAMITWFLRIIGFVAMWIGIGLLFKPLSVVMDVLPFLGNIAEMGIGFVAGLLAFTLSVTTIALAWFFYRPLLGVALLVLIALPIVMLRSRKKKVAAAHAGESSMPPPLPATPPPPPR